MLAAAGGAGAQERDEAMTGDAGQTETAVLAGGCFWCVEHDLAPLTGVIDVVSGYAGGSRPDPVYENYNDVTADYPVPHIEVVQVTYDPAKLSYGALLDAFLRKIDPTDGGGQFCDRGPGYRPAIFAGSDAERQAAEAALDKARQEIGREIAVDILPAARFWPAEDYHQDYAEKNPIRYKFYRWNCGRDQKVEKIWSGQ